MQQLLRAATLALVCLVLAADTGYGQKKGYGRQVVATDSAMLLADGLLAKLTLEEKVRLLGYRNEGVPRLNIPATNWWNEGLHGVARAGNATVFPQVIGLAATFDPELVRQVGEVTSTEARAKYNLAMAKGEHGMYQGLTYWSPNINIFRDPRWGRGQETYGEDPFLTATMGMAYVRGMQGSERGRLKVAAAAKHFVAHSGPEQGRDYFNAMVTPADLHNTYLYAFRRLAEGGVAGIMTSYNRVNGVPNSVSGELLRNTIRKEWGYKGYIVTDCGALDDVCSTHKYLQDRVATAAAAIRAGINLDCSSILQGDVEAAIKRGLITEADVDTALRPLLLTQAKLGMFDKPGAMAYTTYKDDSVHNAAHVALALKAARESMVLLKNDNHVLPLVPGKFHSIMVLGPNAASLDGLVGSYHGVSANMVNFVEGIAGAVDNGTRVEYDLGAGEQDTVHFGGIWAAGNADVTIAVIGQLPVTEGEAGDAFLSPSGGDRVSLGLPASHMAFMRALRKDVKKPIIAVITTGSAVDVAAIAPFADAVIIAWYPGEQGGTALADIVFGKVSPSGRLPVTFYSSVADLPAFDSYGMEGRTYRYFGGAVQYPFGYGLSYSTFSWEQGVRLESLYGAKDTIVTSCIIANTGGMDAEEVVQGYIVYPGGLGLPLKELKAFERVHLAKGERHEVMLKMPVAELRKWNDDLGADKLYPGKYKLQIGGDAGDEKIIGAFTVKE